MKTIHQTENSSIKLSACKQFVLKKQRNARNEIRVLEYINHPRIIKIIDWKREDDIFCVKFPFYPRGDLFDAIHKHPSRLPPPIHVAHQLLDIVSHLHKCDVAHMDIKPENILLDHHGGILLIDFNLACFTSEYKEGTVKGTPEFFPPEVIARKKERCPKKQDMWCVGMVLYEILFHRILINYAMIDGCSCPVMKRLLIGCLAQDASERLTALEAQDMLK